LGAVVDGHGLLAAEENLGLDAPPSTSRCLSNLLGIMNAQQEYDTQNVHPVEYSFEKMQYETFDPSFEFMAIVRPAFTSAWCRVVKVNREQFIRKPYDHPPFRTSPKS
jgi:hypothetical protein